MRGQLSADVFEYIRAMTAPQGILMDDRHGCTADEIRSDVHPESERTCIYPILHRLLRARRIRIAGMRGKQYLYVAREQLES